MYTYVHLLCQVFELFENTFVRRYKCSKYEIFRITNVLKIENMTPARPRLSSHKVVLGSLKQS